MTSIKDKYLKFRYAVVGVSLDPQKYGNRIFKDLLANGFKAEGINPKGGELYSHHIYTNLSELPFVPDIVITVVPPLITLEIIKQCKNLKIKEVWMQPGSDSEEAIKLARELGIRPTAACFMTSNGIW